MNGLVYLVEGASGGRVITQEPEPGKRLEVIISGSAKEVVQVPKSTPIQAVRELPKEKQGKRSRKGRRRSQKRVPARNKTPTKLVVKEAQPIVNNGNGPNVNHENLYYAGNGDLIGRYSYGRAPIGYGRTQKVAFMSVAKELSMSVSKFDRRLETSLMLTDEGFYRLREYVMSNTEDYNVHKTENDAVVVQNYAEDHRIVILRRKRVIVINTPLQFDPSELVQREIRNEKGSKFGVKPWEAGRRAEVYDALVRAYRLFEPVLMKDIE